jgi:hypothetical protein
MADVLDGWGGYAVSYLEQLREDYPKATVVTYGLSDAKMGKTSTMVRQFLLSPMFADLELASYHILIAQQLVVYAGRGKDRRRL